MTALLTEAEAAERLHISARTLRDIRRQGGIHYVAISRRKILYRPEDCDEYIAKCIRRDDAPFTQGKAARRSGAGGSATVIAFSKRKGREA